MPFVVSPPVSLRTGLSNHERPFDKLRANEADNAVFVSVKTQSAQRFYEVIPFVLFVFLVVQLDICLTLAYDGEVWCVENRS